MNTIASINSFRVRARTELRRFDQFANGANTTDRIDYSINFELRRQPGNALIPLQKSQFDFTEFMQDYVNSGNLRSPVQVDGTEFINLKPTTGIQLDSVNFTYSVVATISHLENPVTKQEVTGNELATAATRLLHFNGRLLFGNIPTTFPGIANVPSFLGFQGNAIATRLSVVSGEIENKPTHTYGNGSTLEVLLQTNGDARYNGPNPVALSAPTTDLDTIDNIRFQRIGPLQLGTSGLTTDIRLWFPTGLGYRTNPDGKIVQGSHLFTDQPLSPELEPTSDLS